jgi:hypothetical protein
MNWQGYEYKSEFALRHFTAGEVESLFRVLKARGIPVSERERERIESCRDRGLLSVWIERAATATSLDEVFAHETH